MPNNYNNTLHFIIKCTRKCNLACCYCTERLLEPDSEISVELLLTLFSNINKLPNLNKVVFIWHGGEPLLLGIDFFRKVFFLQSKLLQNIDFSNTIQTNGTCLNDEWIKHLKYYNFQVGLSIDGPATVHDMTRKFINGNPTYEYVTNSIKALNASGLNFGALTVISEKLLEYGGKSLFEYYNGLNIKNYSLMTLRTHWNNLKDYQDYCIKCSGFYDEVFIAWLNNDNPNIHIREIESKLNKYIGMKNLVCKDCGNCVGTYYSVDSTGSISHCDKFKDFESAFFGNIYSNSLEDILNSKSVQRFKEYEIEIRNKCIKCKWFLLCKGGCLYDSIYTKEIIKEKNNKYCINYMIWENQKKFFNKIVKHLTTAST